jgi:hypothetical protein
MKDKAVEQQERRFGAIGFVFFAALASLAHWRGHAAASYIFAVASFLFFVIRFVVPALLHRVYTGWMAVVGVIGKINTYILLSVVFFVIFTPAGLLMRLFGKDKMQRRYDPGAASYWIPIEDKPLDKKRYEQRF